MTNKIYELIPTYTQNQKSFYGKAKVMTGTDGTEILYSYDTPIISRSTDGTLKRLYNGYTTTTGKHIKAFCRLNKQDFLALSIEEETIWMHSRSKLSYEPMLKIQPVTH